MHFRELVKSLSELKDQLLVSPFFDKESNKINMYTVSDLIALRKQFPEILTNKFAIRHFSKTDDCIKLCICHIDNTLVLDVSFKSENSNEHVSRSELKELEIGFISDDIALCVKSPTFKYTLNDKEYLFNNELIEEEEFQYGLIIPQKEMETIQHFFRTISPHVKSVFSEFGILEINFHSAINNNYYLDKLK